MAATFPQRALLGVDPFDHALNLPRVIEWIDTQQGTLRKGSSHEEAGFSHWCGIISSGCSPELPYACDCARNTTAEDGDRLAGRPRLLPKRASVCADG